MKLRLVQLAVMVAMTAGLASASPVSFFDQNLNAGWTVGSGQTNGHFVGVRDSAFSGGGIELGLRAQQRFVGPYTPTLVNSNWGVLPMYTTTTGTSGPNRATWNYDFSINYAGGTGNLDNVTLRADRVSGNLTELNDFSGAGAGFLSLPFDDDTTPGADPVQNSFNGGFGFLSGGYNFSATGLYLITLSATENGQTVSTQMLVNVGNVTVPTPEPVSLVVFGGLIVGGAAAVWRRKKAMTAMTA